ncbi:hypothetical protein B0H11DRAFT_1939648 [Mycena galericulata]|nr:hypothetical protein B0H11DRAFT_1939648 [Mycena galericulata]
MNLPSNATTAPTPAQELAALVAQVASLSKLALDMTKHCIDISDAIPRVVESQVAEAVAALVPSPPQYIRAAAMTPAQVEALHPPGFGDQSTWYVVLVGREPGLYGSSAEADVQVNSVPGQFHRKKDSLREAHAYYRQQYNAGMVEKLVEAPAPVPAAST